MAGSVPTINLGKKRRGEKVGMRSSSKLQSWREEIWRVSEWRGGWVCDRFESLEREREGTRGVGKEKASVRFGQFCE
jgi:hypothetical protein